MSDKPKQLQSNGGSVLSTTLTRREVAKSSVAVGGLIAAGSLGLLGSPIAGATEGDARVLPADRAVPLKLRVNGEWLSVSAEPNVSLLDVLRERAGLTGTKKGCAQGACGACTVHLDGRPVLSCLTLAALVESAEITTVEGLADGDELHQLQRAFIKEDAFQCGFCTPGQLMAGTACISEGATNSSAQIREYMSGNLCRCGAYPNIVTAIQSVAQEG